jgi:hypothetical protein
MVEFEISSKLRPYLLEAQKKFLKYKLENILSLRSGYSIRIYEILKDWLELNKRYGNKAEKIISIDEFRNMLEIPHSYRYNDIKRFVLNKAQEELAKHTDIKFTYEEIKTGRRVTHLKFTIDEIKKDTSNQDKYFFLKSKRTFITYLRKNYINKPILEAPNKKVGGISYWSISERGLIYDMYYNEENINATRSDEIYDGLYEYAKDNPKFAEKLANKNPSCF